ncbi:hypothetical protein [Hymenobacter rigui]|uniref:Uncharacterized protein n=1 Tax=Hymenobacter rigui TaxID=334424 RepID=A0A3R9MVD3_9BACT|nr:hypothetical protein [Hymenobacter rigui]RSK49390.1 hypothetical protein EI291_07820 [Hymenobacter rigui]
MATRKKAPQTLVLDAAWSEDSDTVAALDYPDDVHAALCTSCGELLAWHEAACSPAANLPSAQTTGEQGAEEIVAVASSGFAFDLGQPVQPAADAQPYPVVWRGQLKARHPRTGLVHRVNVYRLDNGYWDCYYETDLLAA